MGDFDTILRCNLGGAALQLTSYKRSAKPLINDTGERYGTELAFECEGEIWAADAAGLAAALAAFTAGASQEATDFTITGQAGAMERVARRDCRRGPHYHYAYGAERGPNFQSVSFTVEAELGQECKAGLPPGVYNDTSALRGEFNPERMETLRISGEVTTQRTVSALLAVLDGLGQPAKIPAADPNWLLTYSYEVNNDDTRCAYEATQTQLRAPYPVDPTPGATGKIVDGEYTVTQAFDEHNRKVFRYQYDYTGDYAQAYIESCHTALRAAGGLMRATVAVTLHKTKHATGEFEVLAGRDGTALLELTEQISHAASGPALRALTYPGTTPLIAVAEQAAWVYEQAGRAIAVGRFPQPPPYKFAVANLMEAPQIVTNRLNDTECETTWRFRFLFDSAQVIQAPSTRALSAGFY